MNGKGHRRQNRRRHHGFVHLLSPDFHTVAYGT
jgi:hypothetical protein